MRFDFVFETTAPVVSVQVTRRVEHVANVESDNSGLNFGMGNCFVSGYGSAIS